MTRRHDWNRLSPYRAVCRACGLEREYTSSWSEHRAVGVRRRYVTQYRGGYCGTLDNPPRPPPCIVPVQHAPYPWDRDVATGAGAPTAAAPDTFTPPALRDARIRRAGPGHAIAGTSPGYRTDAGERGGAPRG